MMRDNQKEMNFPSADELFPKSVMTSIYEISITKIDIFPNHPFKVNDDEDMMSLVESVKENGVLTPATVRKKDSGRYELISGHRRLRACQLAGIPTLRCEIVDMGMDEATIFMVESNFQRTKILPSEKAFAYKMRHEAMKRQGKRSDLTSSPVATKFGRSDSELGELVGESKDQVRRYIRLTELIPELLNLIDEGKIALRPAVELSYISKIEQEHIWQVIEKEQCYPSTNQAIRFRNLFTEGRLDYEIIEKIMLEEKPNQRERIIIKGERYLQLIPPEVKASEREQYIVNALKFYGMFKEKEKTKGGVAR